MVDSIKERVQTQVKDAMKVRDKPRLSALRMITAELKQVEVDERVDLGDDDVRVLAILDKMSKQRKESLAQYESAGRDDLAAQESLELAVIAEFMPEQLGQDEIEQLVAGAISDAGATSMRDMGKVMGLLKPQIQGRADMGEVSAMVKARLA